MPVKLGTIDLENGRVTVDKGSYTPGMPDLKRDRRTQRMTLTFIGDTLDEVAADVSAILAELRTAARIASGLDTGERVAFLWQPGDEPIWFDLVPDENGSCGSLEFPEAATAWLDLSWAGSVVLTLHTTAYGRGMVETRAASGTLTNGASVVHLPNIPGDVPPLVSLTIDPTVSTGSAVLQRLRIGARSLPDMVSGDFDPWIDATDGSGGSTVTVAGAIGGKHERRAASTSWQQVASWEKPAGAANVGRVHAYPLLRDHAVDLRAPSGVSVKRGTATLAYVGDEAQVASASTYGDTLDTLEVALPGPVTEGNTVIAFLGVDNASTTVTRPAGWSVAAEQASSISALKLGIYYKADADAGNTSAVFQLSGNNAMELNMIEVEGLTATPLDDAGGNGSGGNVSVSGASVAQANELLVALTADLTSAAAAFGSPWGNMLNFQWQETLGHVMFGNTGVRFLRRQQTWSTKLSAGSSDATVAASFKSLSPNIGYLPLDMTYEVRVAAKYGSVIGPVSTTASYTVLPAFNGNEWPTALYVSWVAPVLGATPDGYRVYYRIAGGDWYYIDVGAVLVAFLTSFHGATLGEPPIYTSTRSEFRFRYGMSSGETLFSTPAFGNELSTAAWEIPGFGTHTPPATVTLPPQLNEDGQSPESWTLILQGRNVSGQTTNIDADALCLLPAGEDEPVLELEPYTDLAGNVQWEYHQRADGRSVGLLRDAGDEAGALRVRGGLNAGPGDATLALIGDSDDDVADVVDLKYTVQVTIQPRWLLLGRRA